MTGFDRQVIVSKATRRLRTNPAFSMVHCVEWSFDLCLSALFGRTNKVGVQQSVKNLSLRVRARITSAFRIPAAPQLRPGLNRKILSVGQATLPILLNRPDQICGTSGRAKQEVIFARTLRSAKAGKNLDLVCTVLSRIHRNIALPMTRPGSGARDSLMGIIISTPPHCCP